MAGYGDDAAFTEWLTSQGLTLPVDAPAVASLRQIGSDYIDATYGASLQCSRKTGGFDQERAWPRTGHTVGGETIPPDAIPLAWVYASYRAAWLEATSPGWASGAVDPSRRTKREKAGEVEREFFGPTETGGADATGAGNTDAMINGMVSPLLCGDAGRGFLFAVI